MNEDFTPIDRWMEGAWRITESRGTTEMFLVAQLLALGDIFDALRRLANPDQVIVPPPPEPR